MKPDAILHWNQYRVGGGHWTVEVKRQGLASGTPLFLGPPAPPPHPPWSCHQMIMSVPEGGEIVLSYPEPLTTEAIDEAEAMLRLLFRRLRRASQVKTDSGEAEFASWLPVLEANHAS